MTTRIVCMTCGFRTDDVDFARKHAFLFGHDLLFDEGKQWAQYQQVPHGKEYEEKDKLYWEFVNWCEDCDIEEYSEEELDKFLEIFMEC